MDKNKNANSIDAIQQLSSFQKVLEQIQPVHFDVPLVNVTAMEAQNNRMSSNEIEFSIFCVENIAVKLGLSGDEVYQLLTEDKDILDEYIIPNYEMLHTQDKEYIVNDIIEYMKECGVLK